jgi:hypothetical protein
VHIWFKLYYGDATFKSATRKRKQLTGKEEGALWASGKRRKGYSKISPEVREELLDWIADHENVIASAIVKEALLVFVGRNPDI